MGATPVEKRTALNTVAVHTMRTFEDRVNALFGVTNAVCRVDTRERDWSKGMSRDYALRRQVMGDPVWYIQILHTGPSRATRTDSMGTWVAGIHRFSFLMFFQFKDAEQAEDSSNPVFDDMTDGLNPNGIIPAMREAGICQIGDTGKFIQFIPVENDGRSVIPIESTGITAQHVFTMEVDIHDRI